MTESTDPWNIGTLNKTGIWTFYWVSNFFGFFLDATLIYFVCKNTKRSASDVIVCGLVFACAVLSTSCGVQCMINMIADRFVGGDIACRAESVFHVTSVVAEFFCCAALFVNMTYHVVYRRILKPLHALYIVLGMYIFCLLVTISLSFVSPIYLMSAGTYCFFAFSSPGIAMWLVPCLVLALFIMGINFYIVVRHLQKQVATTPPPVSLHHLGNKNDSRIFVNRNQVWKDALGWRSSLFIIGVLAGWFPAIPCCLYEFAFGRASEGLVTALGVTGVSFSWWAPLIYAITSPDYKMQLLNLFRCCKKPQWVERLEVDSQKDSTSRSIPRNRPSQNSVDRQLVSKTTLSSPVPAVTHDTEPESAISLSLDPCFPVGPPPLDASSILMVESPDFFAPNPVVS